MALHTSLVDRDAYHFGRTLSTTRRFTDEQQALDAAQRLANEEDLPVDVYYRPAGAKRPRLYRRILPTE